MDDEQQHKHKRYRFKVALDEALLEDALNGTLGQATTKFLKGITFTNKKANPLQPMGNEKENPLQPTQDNAMNKEEKDQNKKHVPGLITPQTKQNTRDYFYCDNDGDIIFTRESDNTIIIDSDSDDSEDIQFVKDTERTRKTKSIKMGRKHMAKLFKDTNATNAILPKDDTDHFFMRPLKAAYWALHMVGITDEWKPYKRQEKRENIQDLERALECVKAKQPNFQYMEINTQDYGKHGRLFADLDRTPRTEIPENLDVNKLWIIF